MRLQNRQRRLKVDTTGLRRLAQRLLEEEEADPQSTVEIVLLRDRAMADLNERYRDRRGPTDVLSFPAATEGWPPEEPPMLGSVVVSVDRAVVQAGERSLAVRDEIGRLVAHGLLHLLGYRDDTSSGRRRMRRREDRYLRPEGGEGTQR